MPNIRRCECLTVLLLVVAASALAHADSDLSTHVHGDYLVFDKFGDDGRRYLAVVPLKDDANLKLTGQGAMAPVPYIEDYASQDNWLIALTRDRVYVYDVRTQGAPVLAAELHLKDQGQQSGYSQIVKLGDTRFLLLSSVSTAELVAEGNDPGKWKTVDQERASALKGKAYSEPADSAFERAKYTSEHPEPLVLKETVRFRYQLAWKTTHRQAEIVYSKVVQKVDKAGGRVVSELVLGTEIETID